MTLLSFIIAFVVFLVVAPFVGGLLSGVDRIISARMQCRVGPPLLQPFYDVRKLLSKEQRSLNSFMGYYLLMTLLLTIIAGSMFFAGGNLLLVIFLLSLASLFFIVAAYSTRSPFADVGAGREIIQELSYEPMVILMAVFVFLATGSFDVSTTVQINLPLVAVIPFIFIGLLFVLTIKLRKSPFDLSYSHHAHQELVKGVTTEMSGRNLAIVEVIHWYECIIYLGFVGMFFVWASPLTIILAVVVALIIYFFEIVIDNNFARVKWQSMLKWSWTVTICCGVLTLVLFLVSIGFGT